MAGLWGGRVVRKQSLWGEKGFEISVKDFMLLVRTQTPRHTADTE